MNTLIWNDPHTTKRRQSFYAMPIVLQLEQECIVYEEDALSAVAQAMISFLDSRHAGSEWLSSVSKWTHEHQSLKIVKHARSNLWNSMLELPGVNATVGSATVRAICPMEVSISKRQVLRLKGSGLNLPFSENTPYVTSDTAIPMSTYMGVSFPEVERVKPLNNSLAGVGEVRTGKRLVMVADLAHEAYTRLDKKALDSWKANRCSVKYENWKHRNMLSRLLIKDSSTLELKNDIFTDVPPHQVIAQGVVRVSNADN